MDQKPRLQKAPKPTDLEGWRQAISQGLLATFRLEDIVAAIQDLGPLADSNIRNPLARHLSNAMTRLLRRLVGLNHPNQGEDIIYRVHGQLFEALLKSNSADGKGLRKAFTARVSFRVKDAIAAEYQHSRIPTEAKIKNAAKGHDNEEIEEVEEVVAEREPTATASDSTVGGTVTPLNPSRDLSLLSGSSGHDSADDADESDWSDGATPRNSNRDLSLLDGVRDLDQRIDIERLMQAVPDPRKRLAFYLYMDDVPYGSTRGYSIARALGVSAKTAKEWVEEVQDILQSDTEIQELQKASLGDRT
jgi:uncharacterized protein YdaT